MSDSKKRDIAEPRGSTAYRGRHAPMEADFPGTALRSRDFKSDKVLKVDDEFRVAYAWDAGIAIGAYLDGLRDGKITNEGRQYTFSGVAIYRPEFFADCSPGRFPLAPMLRAAADECRLGGSVYRVQWQDVGTVERLDALKR